MRVAAGQIILSERIVRIDGERSGYPFPGTVVFAEFKKRGYAQMGGTRIFRVWSKFALGEVGTFSCGLFGLLIAAVRAVDRNEKANRLRISGLNFGRAFE